MPEKRLERTRQAYQPEPGRMALPPPMFYSKAFSFVWPLPPAGPFSADLLRRNGTAYKITRAQLAHDKEPS